MNEAKDLWCYSIIRLLREAPSMLAKLQTSNYHLYGVVCVLLNVTNLDKVEHSLL